MAMPTVRRFNRCRIEMYFGDHPPPHFHVITRSNEAAVFLIETLAQWAGEAGQRDTAEALAWAAFNRPELWARWQQYSEEKS
jgi:Domain of unknown function (DUF4160)